MTPNDLHRSQHLVAAMTPVEPPDLLSRLTDAHHVRERELTRECSERRSAVADASGAIVAQLHAAHLDRSSELEIACAVCIDQPAAIDDQMLSPWPRPPRACRDRGRRLDDGMSTPPVRSSTR
jgi:hypothetical protein